MQDNPLVTVYIPTYNRVELLKRAVESVRNQTYQNLEIIIVDDCSQDATAEYLKEISKKDSRIRYFIKEKNSGACASRNIAINNAQGEYITGLDDDDIFLPERIALFLKYSKKYDMDKTMLFSGYTFTKKVSYKNKIRSFLEKKKVIASDLILRNYIGNQVFIKTAIFKKNNGFDESFKMWQDFEFWYRILKNEDSIAIQIPQITYGVDATHNLKRITDFKNLFSTYESFCDKHKLTEKDKNYLKLHFYHFNLPDPTLSLLIKRFIKSKNLMDLWIVISHLKKHKNHEMK